MPVYTCIAPSGWLDGEQKHELAQAITRIHVDATGAPASFVHTIYLEVPAADLFVAGAPAPFLRVDGRIRAGRVLETKQRLVMEIASACVRITGRDRDLIGVSIIDVPSAQALEGGRIMPDPGGEAAWLAATQDPR